MIRAGRSVRRCWFSFWQMLDWKLHCRSHSAPQQISWFDNCSLFVDPLTSHRCISKVPSHKSIKYLYFKRVIQQIQETLQECRETSLKGRRARVFQMYWNLKHDWRYSSKKHFDFTMIYYWLHHILKVWRGIWSQSYVSSRPFVFSKCLSNNSKDTFCFSNWNQHRKE